MDDNAFGARLREARRARGLSRADLAERLGAGNERDIGRWERGERDVRLSTVRRLAAALDYPVAALVTEVDQ